MVIVMTKRDILELFVLIGITLLPLIAITISAIIKPQPSYREICESNGGIFIENSNGRAGNLCIFNNEGKK